MHAETRLRMDERGIALYFALVALLAMGAMVTGTFLIGWVEQRSAAAGWYATQSFEAAEAGAAEAIAAWDPALARLPLRTDSVVRAGVTLVEGTTYTATVTRWNPGTFLVRSEGLRRGPGGDVLSRRLVGIFVRVRPADVDHGSALTLNGSAAVPTAEAIDGSDEPPPGWESICPPVAAVPAIRTSGAAVTADSGPAPPVVIDTLIGPETFSDFGPVTFDQLAATATLQVGGTVGPLAPFSGDGKCAAGSGANWGEPGRDVGAVAECFDFLPIVHAAGNLTLSGGRGQGILLVGGDLELTGAVGFTGVVVVRGRVITSGAGGRILGTLLVGGASGPSAIGAGSFVRYSSCAVNRALLAAGLPRRLRERSWVQLY